MSDWWLIGLIPLLLVFVSCGTTPEEEAGWYDNQADYNQYSYGNQQADNRPTMNGLAQPTEPVRDQSQFPQAPLQGSVVNLERRNQPFEQAPGYDDPTITIPPPNDPIEDAIDDPLPWNNAPTDGSEASARTHLVEEAWDVYYNLEAGKRYPVNTGYGTTDLLVSYPAGTNSTVSDASTMMCTDYVLYAFTKAGYDLAEAGVGSRATGTINGLFKNNNNGDNIIYKANNGTAPPEPGDILFMSSHVAIIVEVGDGQVTFSQFNARNIYTHSFSSDGGQYRMAPWAGQEIYGWGFYYKK